ncbi:glycosyltransferase family 4 protein [Hymenobacter setariae]|uniref:Glycosyltransferase family 4 protein n=1 Tax=Hymenobacter setariae TaxID=2594794 RepID=A0A558BYC2_9BACT|nr:glycosyltransferase family 4 protein [Hymenobacter setariae]TVT41520.1 glycosyltransferase family 4 protein [Hymenobacter setariae]
MKIVFLCGCLEPGRDGVGDYARRLAIELVQQGHEAYGISLNDTYVTQATLESQPVDEASLTVLRLPAAWPEGQRFERAQQQVATWQPDWLSLQFVPFSFHPKGLNISLAKHLASLGKGRAWHIMFHELWVGMDTHAPLKHQWWGRAQQYLITQLINKLKPRVIHTQTLLYQAQLQKIGFASEHLPLFANISNNAPQRPSTATGSSDPAVADKAVQLVVFGNIHVGTPIQQLARDAAQYARTHDTTVTLTLLGRCGSEQALWAATWQAAGLPVEILGEQEPARISEVLLGATLGIATTPAVLLGKSGTAAAMQEHGLPVLCVAHAWQPRGITLTQTTPGIAVYQEGNFGTYLTKQDSQPVRRLPLVARQLADALARSR